MSKQLKYKLKKTLKNAEFVHADLEYHQEVSQDAIRNFQEEIARVMAKLSDEDKQKLQDYLNSQAPPGAPPRAVDPLSDEEESEESECTDMIPAEEELEETQEETATIDRKAELKKLFYRIAERTHPDKLEASGFSDQEVARMERLFIRAKQAYDDDNWYILYALAIELDLSIDDPSDEQVEWIEEDIKKTLAKISAIANLTAWHWYVGDEEAKKNALKYYFHQVYGLEFPDLNH